MKFYKYKFIKLFFAIVISIFSYNLIAFCEKTSLKSPDITTKKSISTSPAKKINKFSKNQNSDTNVKIRIKKTKVIQDLKENIKLYQTEEYIRTNSGVKITKTYINHVQEQNLNKKDQNSVLKKEEPKIQKETATALNISPIVEKNQQEDPKTLEQEINEESEQEWNNNFYVNTDPNPHISHNYNLDFVIKLISSPNAKNYILGINTKNYQIPENYYIGGYDELEETIKIKEPVIKTLKMESIINFLKFRFRTLYTERINENNISSNLLKNMDQYKDSIFESKNPENDFNLFEIVDIIAIDDRVKIDKPFNLDKSIWSKVQRGTNCILYVRKEFIKNLTFQEWYNLIFYLPMKMN